MVRRSIHNTNNNIQRITTTLSKDNYKLIRKEMANTGENLSEVVERSIGSNLDPKYRNWRNIAFTKDKVKLISSTLKLMRKSIPADKKTSQDYINNLKEIEDAINKELDDK